MLYIDESYEPLQEMVIDVGDTFDDTRLDGGDGGVVSVDPAVVMVIGVDVAETLCFTELSNADTEKVYVVFDLRLVTP